MIGTECFRVEQAGDMAIVRIVDTWSFDIEDYAQLRHDLADLIEQHRPKKLIVDLSNIEACSTALTRALLMAQKQMQPWAGVMKLVGLSEVVQENFIVKQFGDVTVIQIVDTRYFDTDNYAQLQEDLAYFVARQQPRELLVDLSNIRYCSTALIAALLMARKCLQTGPGVMRLVGLSEDVLESVERLMCFRCVPTPRRQRTLENVAEPEDGCDDVLVEFSFLDAGALPYAQVSGCAFSQIGHE